MQPSKSSVDRRNPEYSLALLVQYPLFIFGLQTGFLGSNERVFHTNALRAYAFVLHKVQDVKLVCDLEGNSS